MSVRTWLSEFCPKHACEVRGTLDGIEHSLTKWRGLTRENRERHGLMPETWDGVKRYHHLWDGNTFVQLEIDSETCALCRAYLRDGDCYDCPLNQYLGDRCDRGPAPYGAYTEGGDAEPMIAALEAVLKLAQREAAK